MINTLNHILTKYQILTNLTFNIHIFILFPYKKIKKTKKKNFKVLWMKKKKRKKKKEKEERGSFYDDWTADSYIPEMVWVSGSFRVQLTSRFSDTVPQHKSKSQVPIFLAILASI